MTKKRTTILKPITDRTHGAVQNYRHLNRETRATLSHIRTSVDELFEATKAADKVGDEYHHVPPQLDELVISIREVADEIESKFLKDISNELEIASVDLRGLNQASVWINARVLFIADGLDKLLLQWKENELISDELVGQLASATTLLQNYSKTFLQVPDELYQLMKLAGPEVSMQAYAMYTKYVIAYIKEVGEEEE